MMGLGLVEIAVIVGVVVLLFGATGAKKLIATARSVRDTKRDLTSGAVLGRLVDSDDTKKSAETSSDKTSDKT